MQNEKLVSFLLRLGLASVLLYASLASILDPNSWIGFLPEKMREMFPAATLLTIFSIYEIVLALWLLSDYKIFYAALLAALTMAAVVVTNIQQLDIVFRDVAILFSALALAALKR